MPITANILERKSTHFVLWRPSAITTPPTLLIGQLRPGNPPTFIGAKQFPLTPTAGVQGLWEIAATDCQLQQGQVYHYWFEVEDTSSGLQPLPRVRCTDPLAFAVDWRLFPPDTTDNRQPAAIIKFENGRLTPCDAGGEVGSFDNEPRLDTLPANNRLVIYELPTAWTMSRVLNEPERAVGTFRDVRALLTSKLAGPTSPSLPFCSRAMRT